MKLNIDENPEAAYYEVYCDGNKLQYCVEADDKEGIAWILVFGDDGLPIGDEDEALLIEAKIGKIEFRDTRPHNKYYAYRSDKD